MEFLMLGPVNVLFYPVKFPFLSFSLFFLGSKFSKVLGQNKA